MRIGFFLLNGMRFAGYKGYRGRPLGSGLFKKECSIHKKQGFFPSVPERLFLPFFCVAFLNFAQFFWRIDDFVGGKKECILRGVLRSPVR